MDFVFCDESIIVVAFDFDVFFDFLFHSFLKVSCAFIFWCFEKPSEKICAFSFGSSMVLSGRVSQWELRDLFWELENDLTMSHVAFEFLLRFMFERNLSHAALLLSRMVFFFSARLLLNAIWFSVVGHFFHARRQIF